MFIYVIQYAGKVKVGVSTNAEKRIGGIMTGLGISKLDKQAIYECTRAIDVEQSVITHFSQDKLNGEWFTAKFEDVCDRVLSVITEIESRKESSGNHVIDAIMSCFVDRSMVDLTALNKMLNEIREEMNAPDYQLAAFLRSKTLSDYLEAASHEWGMEESQLLKKATGKRSGHTIGHISIALLLAETISIGVKATIHKAVIEGWFSRHESTGGTEFKNLNAAIELYLPDRLGKDNKGVFINVAKLIRERILGSEAKTEDWNVASVAQTHLRYEWENKLCDMLRLGVVRDYDHIKQLIHKL